MNRHFEKTYHHRQGRKSIKQETSVLACGFRYIAEDTGTFKSYIEVADVTGSE
jgi:hypothetical protein